MRKSVMVAIVSMSPWIVETESSAQQKDPSNEDVKIVQPSGAGAANAPPSVGGAVGGQAPRNPVLAFPIEQLSATRDRPLFSLSRRPKPPAPPPTAPVLPQQAAIVERPQLILIGTAISDTEKTAIFMNKSSRTVARAHQGETILGWRLLSVDHTMAILEKGNETMTIDLRPAGMTGMPGMPALPDAPRAPLTSPGKPQ